MKLLVNIDDKLFREVRKLTRSKTKKDNIIIPMTEYLKHAKRMQLLQMLGGTYRHGMTLQKLLKTRRNWQKS